MRHATKPAKSVWLKDIPVDWDEIRFRHVATIEGRLVDPTEDPWSALPMLAPNHVEKETGKVSGLQTASEQGADSAKYPVRRGQIVYSKIRPALNKVAIAPENGTCSADMYPVEFSSRLDTRFAWYYMRARPFHAFATVTSMRVKMPKINREDLSDAPFLVPPLDQQRAIADYLDRETARIDNLIDAQQRLIELSQHRRSAFIRHTLDLTYNPLAWDRSRPATRVGHLYTVTLGKMLDGGRASREGDSLLPYIRAGNIQDDGLDLSDIKSMPFSEAEAAMLDIRRGDILVVEGGAIGTSVVVDADMPGWSFQKTVNRVRPSGSSSSRWLAYIFRAYRDSGVFDILCNKSTIPHLTAEKLRTVRVPIVAPDEQRRLVRRLDAETKRVDDHIAEARRLSKLALERRAALITAAVTGQIDVGGAA